MMRSVVILLFASCTSPAPDCPKDEPASCPTDVPSYATVVAPLIQQYCGSCHDASGSAADEPILTYAGLFPRRLDALDELYECEMPMLPAPQPTLADRVTLLTWFICGAPNN